MIGIIDQFCNAYTEWDRRSKVGDVFLSSIMLNIGGHARRGIPPDEPGEYSVDDVRNELPYLTDQLRMDAGFLVASLIRAVDAELVETSGKYEKMPPGSFTHFGPVSSATRRALVARGLL